MKGTLGRLVRLAAPFGWWMALATLLGFATIGSSVGLLTTSAYLISAAALQPSIADLQVAIVAVRFFGIARGVFRYLERYVSHETTFRLLARLRAWFYAALEPLAPARLLQYRSGDLLARIVADIGTLEDFYLRAIAPPAVAVLVALLATALMGSFNPRLAIALLAFLLLAGIGVPLLVQVLGCRTGQRLVGVRAELNSTLVDGIQGVADLLAYGQEGRHLDRVRRLSRELGSLQGRMARFGGISGALTGLLMDLAIVAVLVIAIPLVTTGALNGVYLALLVMVVVSSFEAMWPLPKAFQYLENNLEAGRRLFEIVDVEPAVTDPPSALSAPATHDLLVENLHFAYNEDEQPALAGISLTLPKGKRVAVVGPSGAGKSTLVQLLLRFWDYEEGQILLAGQELRCHGQEEVRDLIAVVSQHTHLFGASVRENLLLARPDATEAEMVQAARQAQIHEFVESLPEGYGTWIGEQGLQLSGGQRQRLAIARAILKDSPILILDEATANLDSITEREVMGTLQALMAGRTALIISHRLVGIEDVDEILVLREGRIVEGGRHHDLMQMDGYYRRMWELQHQCMGQD